MSLLDKLTGRTAEQDEATDRALQQQHDAEQRKSELLLEVDRLQTKIGEEKQQLGEKLFTGEEEDADRLQASIDQAERKLQNTFSAIEFADRRIAEADIALHKANAAGRLKTYRRLTTKRAKHTAELSEALAAYVTAHRKVRETNDQLSSGWPFQAGVISDAAFTSPNALNRTISSELAILAEVSPLDDKGWLPGASTHTLLLSSGKPATLLEETERANQFVLQAIERGPAAPVSIEEPVSLASAPPASAPDVPAAPDPDSHLLILNPNPVSFPSQPRSGSITIDHRRQS